MGDAINIVSHTLRRELPALEGVKRWVVGLSGGLDSSVLLHGLSLCGFSQPIIACHIHHGLSDHADQWQEHCQSFCAELGVAFVDRAVAVSNLGGGVEEAARQSRYQAFEDLLEPGDCLLLAHHRDDQAETLLLRLMRGAGPKGLAAIPAQRPIGKAQLYRPLLELSRGELEAYAQTHELRWVEDDSNSDEGFDRNYLRRQVMPLLQARWPEFSRNWQASAELCRQQSELSEALAVDDLAEMDPQRDRAGHNLSLKALQQLPSSRRQLLLRVWCEQLNIACPSRAQLLQIEQQLISHRQDSEAEVQWAGYSMRCYQQRLYLYLTPATPEPGWTTSWDLTHSLSLGSSQLQTEQADVGLQAGREYGVCYRSGGERCKPQGRNHSQTLKKLLQEYGLQPWLRDRVPLLYLGDQLVAVGDLWICDGYAVEGGLKIDWQTRLTQDSQPSVISPSGQDLD
ncbi:tRNA lysidine(34) synthetase TilS [Maricurvus nonylphenolicus]|uniref:tRNA lysidine(34) synthetase TilS n=1 Tax=Maricurvus nonylphenolicus TaxID=1008307 RepID=UPI0036F34600